MNTTTEAQTSTAVASTTRILPQEDAVIERLRATLGEIEMDVLTSYTLADAIREGSSTTEQAFSWGSGESACALSAGYLAAKARGFIK